MTISPNPKNCYTCKWADVINSNIFCRLPMPAWIIIDNRMVGFPSETCAAHEAAKGLPVRICLNCGEPVATHHKYTEIYAGQWIHKFCEHPESPSRYHYEQFHKGE